MIYNIDLHIHSPFSDATSPSISFQSIADTATRKGIHVMGTGDCFNPDWRVLISMLPVIDGIIMVDGIMFFPSVEVSCEKVGSRKKVHVLLVFEDMDEADLVRDQLLEYGDLLSGRPALDIGVKELTAVVRDTSPSALIIIAHIMTPWTGLLGSRNYIDSIDDVYGIGDIPPDAIETGLSADPPMLRSISELDRFPLVSFSDAHSTPNIGRELTIIETDRLDYGIMRENVIQGHIRTLEFYPQLGKYHYSGHRHCSYSVGPGGNIMCKRCNKRVILGVAWKIEEMRDRDMANYKDGVGDCKFQYIIPLRTIIMTALHMDKKDRRITEIYNRITASVMEIPFLTGYGWTEGVPEPVRDLAINMRMGFIKVIPGYDGVFGEIIDLYTDLGKILWEINKRKVKKKEYGWIWDKMMEVDERLRGEDATIERVDYDRLMMEVKESG